MPSKVDIANRALSRIGARTIVSFSDNTNEARAVKSAYEEVRLEVLHSHPWNSVMTRVEIAKLTDVPAFGYANQYQVPSDALRIVEVLDAVGTDPTELPWAVESKLDDESLVILTDESSPLKVRYMKDVDDPNRYSALLRSAIAARLAVELCPKLKQSTATLERMLVWHREIMQMAKHADGREGAVTERVRDSWIDSRYQGTTSN